MPTPNTLLFDLDGTLVDSAPDLALAVHDTLTQLGRDMFPQNTIRGWVGIGAKVLVEPSKNIKLSTAPHTETGFLRIISRGTLGGVDNDTTHEEKQPWQENSNYIKTKVANFALGLKQVTERT